MTIWDVLSVAGAVAGMAVLAVMALAPVLLALPLPRAAAEPAVRIPAQRTTSGTARRTAEPALRIHSAA